MQDLPTNTKNSVLSKQVKYVKYEEVMSKLSEITDGDIVKANFYVFNNYKPEERSVRGFVFNLAWGKDSDDDLYVTCNLNSLEDEEKYENVFVSKIEKL